MEDIVISRRQGLKALGAAAGAALIGTGLAKVANAAPRILTPGPDGTQYAVTVVNNSSNDFDICMYQEDPDLGVPNVMSLAWFTKFAVSNSNVRFSWTIDYSFVWSETGFLKPGVNFTASQTWPADPSVNRVGNVKQAGNQLGLTHGKGYEFTSTPTKGAQVGTLYIAEDGTIPLKQASVGIGMGGSGTFAVQAQPNLPLTFTPHPNYWVTAGSFSKGEVMDIGAITNAASIEFEPGVFEKTAILNPDNTWTVK